MNEFEIKELLEFVIFNQAYLHQRIQKLENNLSSSSKSASVLSSIKEMKREFNRTKDDVLEVVHTI